MRYRVTSLVLVAFVVLSLVGCGSKDDSAASPSPDPTKVKAMTGPAAGSAPKAVSAAPKPVVQ